VVAAAADHSAEVVAAVELCRPQLRLPRHRIRYESESVVPVVLEVEAIKAATTAHRADWPQLQPVVVAAVANKTQTGKTADAVEVAEIVSQLVD
jgi:hypothetical protein